MTANIGEGPDRAPDPADEQTYDIPADTFSARLVLARHFAGGLSIEQAAKACGLNSGNWAHWEGGRRPRDAFDVAQAISEGLRIDRQWLMFGGALTPGKGKPTRRPNQVTARYPVPAGPPAATHPKGRTDPRGPLGMGRRAALVGRG